MNGLALLTLVVNLFPANTVERHGFVRLTNREVVAAEVTVRSFDDQGTAYPDETISVPTGDTLHFNSVDLELGNAAKGLAGIGTGVGDWRLVFETDARLDVMAYARTADGFLSSLHDTVPGGGGRWRIPIFNPASNINQVSILRLVNPGNELVSVVISGTDDAGRIGDDSLEVQIQPNAARTLTAVDMEAAFGDGTGKWRLDLRADQPLVVMSLLRSPTGHLTNISTETRRRRPVPREDNRLIETVGSGPVYAAVVDAVGFGDGEHGRTIVDIYAEITERATLTQIAGWCSHELDGTELLGQNYCGFIHHAHTRGNGIFWTATDQNPRWQPDHPHWFMRDGRPFTKRSRVFASWARDENILLVDSLENATCTSSTEEGPCDAAAYCDDFDSDAETWIPMCGEVSDYIAHSGIGLENVLFVGAIDERSDTASGAIRADGVFAPHAIYVESSNGSTSRATPVLAAYATNLAADAGTIDAATLKTRLLDLAQEETLDYLTGASNERGQAVTESRTIKVIRPDFAP